MGNLSEAGESLSIPLVNLAGFLTGGVLTLGARVWARRIETGKAIFRPKPGPPMTERGEPLLTRGGDQVPGTESSG